MVKASKIIQFVTIACVAIMMHADQVLQPSYMSYAQIADRYIKNVDLEKAVSTSSNTKPTFMENNFTSSSGLQKNLVKKSLESMKQFLDKKFEHREQQKLVFTIFDHVHGNTHGSSYSPLDRVAHDLNLFAYQSKKVKDQDKSLFAAINRTSTVFGEVFLAHQLANPISDITELSRRQKIVKALVDDEKFFNKVESLVQQLKDNQENILKNYVPLEQTIQYIIDQEYWHGTNIRSKLFKPSNTRPYMNEFLDRLSTMIDVYIFGKGVYRGYELIKTRNEGSLSNAENVSLALKAENVSSALNAENLSLVFLAIGIVDYLKSLSLKLLGFGQEVVERRQEIGKKTYERMFATTKGLAVLAKNTEHITRMMHTQAGVMLQHSLPAHKDLGKEYEQLCDLLENSPFQNAGYERSFWNLDHGRLRAAYYLAQQYKPDFIKHMQVIGELDAYLSIAKLYKEHQKEGKAHYSFVDFVQEDAPSFKAQGFWNPMLAADKAVTNSLTMGGNGPRVITVTGSNTGGKSTIVSNGLALMVMLAQTLGIAPVESLKMRPFDYIATFMKVEEDIVDGNSRYHAEIKAAAKIQKDLRALPENATAAIFVDEAFTGTNEQSGSKALYSFASDLISNKKVLASIVTHYKNLTLLEQKGIGECKNYRVDVSVNGNDIKRPYKLEPGVSEVNIADKLYRDEQKNELISEID